MKKPRVIVNCAMSIDGKIALPSRKQTRISNDEDIARVHRLRNQCDAILVGIGTVLADDPSLLVKKRYVKNVSCPLRIVLDSTYRIPAEAQVFTGDAHTLIVTTCKEEHNNGVEVIRCGSKGERVDLTELMKILYKRGIRRLMVEGGETVIWELLAADLVDELMVFIAPLVIGGTESPTLAGGKGAQSIKEIIHLKIHRMNRIGGGILIFAHR